MKTRNCVICGKDVPPIRVLEKDAVTCSDECAATNVRFLAWLLERKEA